MQQIDFAKVLVQAPDQLIDGKVEASEALAGDGIVSFQAELPEPLQLAMQGFIEKYPNWDQYRLFQAALAGFLVQQGVDSRQITRLYVANMFGNESLV